MHFDLSRAFYLQARQAGQVVEDSIRQGEQLVLTEISVRT